jgi:hypothetical protein
MEAKAGMIGILHTWTQKMGYHPHLHCIIPSGGITEKRKQQLLRRLQEQSLFFGFCNMSYRKVLQK